MNSYQVLGYTADADAYCPECARTVYGDVDSPDTKDREGDTIGAIFADSEWDFPIHCCACRKFLQNALTAEGVEYVRGAVTSGDGDIVNEWRAFYADALS